jgi:hypothetical protein
MSEQGTDSISLKVEYDPLLDVLDVTVRDAISDPVSASEVQDGVVAVFDTGGSLAQLHITQASFGRSPEWRAGLATLMGQTAERRFDAASRACLPLQSTMSLSGEEAAQTRAYWADAFQATRDDSEYLLTLIAETTVQESEPVKASSHGEVISAKQAALAGWMRDARQRVATLWDTAAEVIADHRPVPALGPIRGPVNAIIELDRRFALRAGVYPEGEITILTDGIEIEFNRIESHDLTLAVTWEGAQDDVVSFASHEFRALAQLPAPARGLARTDFVLDLVFFTVR